MLPPVLPPDVGQAAAALRVGCCAVLRGAPGLTSATDTDASFIFIPARKPARGPRPAILPDPSPRCLVIDFGPGNAELKMMDGKASGAAPACPAAPAGYSNGCGCGFANLGARARAALPRCAEWLTRAINRGRPCPACCGPAGRPVPRLVRLLTHLGVNPPRGPGISASQPVSAGRGEGGRAFFFTAG